MCPVCAALPGGDPNHVTDDFAAHLTLEHRAPSRDILISSLFENKNFLAILVAPEMPKLNGRESGKVNLNI